MGRCRGRKGTLFATAVGLAAAAIAAGEGHLEELKKREQLDPSRLLPSAEVFPRRTAVVRRGRDGDGDGSGRTGRGSRRGRRNLEEIAEDGFLPTPPSFLRQLAGGERSDDEQHPSEHETAEPAGWTGEKRGQLVEEPPSIVHIHPRNIDRCLRWNATEAAGTGAACGPPLAEPCFDRSRCRRLTVYVYDQEV